MTNTPTILQNDYYLDMEKYAKKARLTDAYKFIQSMKRGTRHDYYFGGGLSRDALSCPVAKEWQQAVYVAYKDNLVVPFQQRLDASTTVYMFERV